ncbi:EFR1 family ferrodoxin [Clostridium estertheticum]|uniref:EFR1 family ferrodoxin n=1 Tax=Clostridium estertheticum TaxID=238834 RepID=UPI001C0B13DF|nr:EFR1 family ferrodoxin [Clostridium estertheticum]MBU3183305.1 EFR1 family ferrodoxin [Clostridium estertheticum]MCB2339019.1 EFR1 family ferrodoxin [Clostridium estertheticum]
MVIETDTILYFSGTGNSLQVAKDISNNLDNVLVYGLASLIDAKEIEVKSKILGIVFPVYYARLPLIVEKLVRKLKINKDTYVFAVVTYGGAPAEVLIKLRNLLQNGGRTLNSGFLLRMPANHIFAYNPSSTKKHNMVFEREKTKIKEISAIINERTDYSCERSKLLLDTIIDRVFIKTTNKIMANFHSRDEKFWVNNKCNSCRLCEKICPVNNIEFNLNNPIWKHNCEQCTACIQYCPKEAIQWGNKTKKRRRYRNPNVNIIELLRIL